MTQTYLLVLTIMFHNGASKVSMETPSLEVCKAQGKEWLDTTFTTEPLNTQALQWECVKGDYKVTTKENNQ